MVTSVAPLASRGLQKLDGRLVPTCPRGGGRRPRGRPPARRPPPRWRAPCVPRVPCSSSESGWPPLPARCRRPRPQPRRPGARLAWVPRRAGERGAVEAGALPGTLPGGRPLSSEALVDVALAWGVDRLPSRPGRDTTGILAAAACGRRPARRRGGHRRPALPGRGSGGAASLPVRRQPRGPQLQRHRARRRRAARGPAGGEDGLVHGLGRPAAALRLRAPHGCASATTRSSTSLPEAMGAQIGAAKALQPARRARADRRLGRQPAPRAGRRPGPRRPRPRAGQAVLATWHLLLDAGRGQDGEAYLSRYRPPRPRPALAGDRGSARHRRDGGHVQVSTGAVAAWSLVLPVRVDATVVDGVVWLPTRSRRSEVTGASRCRSRRPGRNCTRTRPARDRRPGVSHPAGPLSALPTALGGLEGPASDFSKTPGSSPSSRPSWSSRSSWSTSWSRSGQSAASSAGCSSGPAPTATVPSACCRAWPTGSSSRSRRTSSPRAPTS